MMNEHHESEERENQHKDRGHTHKDDESSDIEIFVPGDTPIVVTGGSLKIEYADKRAEDDAFDDDNSTAGTKKKLRHSKHNSDPDKVRLTTLQVFDRDSGDKLAEVNLQAFRNRGRCRVEIHYEIIP